MDYKKRKLIAGMIIIIILFVPISGTALDNYNPKEVGVEWVTDYGPCGLGNLGSTRSDATGFYNTLGSRGWTMKWNYGNNLAWESDFEKQSEGGSDYIYADQVDFAYFSGHGSPDAFYFGSPHDGNGWSTCKTDKSEVSWGDTDLEWIVLSACQALQYNSGWWIFSQNVYQRWGQAFNGLHQILGYDTISYDYSMGTSFAKYMTRSWYEGGTLSIRDAWFQANIDIQPSDVYSAVLSTDAAWYDYLPGYGPVGSDWGSYLYWQRVQS